MIKTYNIVFIIFFTTIGVLSYVVTRGKSNIEKRYQASVSQKHSQKKNQEQSQLKSVDDDMSLSLNSEDDNADLNDHHPVVLSEEATKAKGILEQMAFADSNENDLFAQEIISLYKGNVEKLIEDIEVIVDQEKINDGLNQMATSFASQLPASEETIRNFLMHQSQKQISSGDLSKTFAPMIAAELMIERLPANEKSEFAAKFVESQVSEVDREFVQGRLKAVLPSEANTVN